ncbi:MAG: FAD:protein FMN transferase, partial [Candidatus Latescibacteria bacterium]|nr:FAD:protein FMN transferase [Candidatus Latescibacterota bacterium]
MKRIISYLLLVLLVALAFWRIYRPVRLWEAVRPMMDTAVTVKLCAQDSSAAQNLLTEVFAEMERIDRMMDNYSPTSEITSINSTAGKERVSISPEMGQVLKRSQYFAELSGGAFDITIGPVKEVWDFESENPTVPLSGQLAAALTLVGYQNVQLDGGRVRLLKPRMKLDLGGVAKGYAVDCAVEFLKERGAKSALVEAGGDVRLYGEKPSGRDWQIAIRHPREKEKLIRVGKVELPAVATSGDYERLFVKDGKRYHHILDPNTGYPAKGCVSVTVWTQTAT